MLTFDKINDESCKIDYKAVKSSSHLADFFIICQFVLAQVYLSLKSWAVNELTQNVWLVAEIHIWRRFTMDAIRKKMQSLKGETDSLYKTIAGFEEATKEASDRADKVTLNSFLMFC